MCAWFSSKRRWVFAAAAVTALFASQAGAADLPTKAPPAPPVVAAGWTYTATPYFWATSLTGSTTVKGRTTDIDASFIDIARHTEFPKNLMGLMGYFEARNNRFAIFADLIYMKVGINASQARSHAVGNLNVGVGLSAGMKVEMFIAELAGAYEVARWGAGIVPGSGTALDVYGGVRAWWLKGEASFEAAGTVNLGDLTINADGTRSASGDVSWADPLVGARLRHQFAPGLNLVLSGDIGGFGVGSKFSWQTIAAVNYDFAVRNGVTWSGMVGYRALSVDYSKGAGLDQFEYDMTMHGPVFGVTAKF